MDVSLTWVMIIRVSERGGTVHIKIFDGIVRELKKVRYVPQLKRNLISVGALETLGLMVSIRDSVLKMIKGSMVVMKGSSEIISTT